MICDVSACGRKAIALVTFRHSTRPVPYCRRHAFHPWKPRLAWDAHHVAEMQRLDVAN